MLKQSKHALAKLTCLSKVNLLDLFKQGEIFGQLIKIKTEMVPICLNITKQYKCVFGDLKVSIL
jgi:hypothetical protein